MPRKNKTGQRRKLIIDPKFEQRVEKLLHEILSFCLSRQPVHHEIPGLRLRAEDVEWFAAVAAPLVALDVLALLGCYERIERVKLATGEIKFKAMVLLKEKKPS